LNSINVNTTKELGLAICQFIHSSQCDIETLSGVVNSKNIDSFARAGIGKRVACSALFYSTLVCLPFYVVSKDFA
jgi:hypothetical protein